MAKTKVTLSIDEDTWKEFRIFCIKNNTNASEILNDIMASMTGKTPRTIKYDIEVSEIRTKKKIK